MARLCLPCLTLRTVLALLRSLPVTATPQESTKKSMPAYGFGTSTRAQANQVYWKGKAAGAGGKDSPGPSYQLRASVGGQVPQRIPPISFRQFSSTRA